MGECFFWYRPTPAVPDKRPLNGCVCVCVVTKGRSYRHTTTSNWYRKLREIWACKKGKGSPYSITERRVPELIPVLGSQPASDVSHKPGGRLPYLQFSARPAVKPATLKWAATNFAAW